MSAMRQDGSNRSDGNEDKAVANEDLNKVAYKELLCEYMPRPIESRKAFDAAHSQLSILTSKKSRSSEEQVLANLLIVLCRAYEEQLQRRYSPQKNLKRFMDRLNLKQVEVAHGTGIPESTISAVLSGQRDMSKECAARLAKFFGISVDHFIREAQL